MSRSRSTAACATRRSRAGSTRAGCRPTLTRRTPPPVSTGLGRTAMRGALPTATPSTTAPSPRHSRSSQMPRPSSARACTSAMRTTTSTSRCAAGRPRSTTRTAASPRRGHGVEFRLRELRAVAQHVGRGQQARAAGAGQGRAGRGDPGGRDGGGAEGIVLLCWILRWWVPTPCLTYCGRMKRIDVRQVWHEKLALNLLIWFMCGHGLCDRRAWMADLPQRAGGAWLQLQPEQCVYSGARPSV
ncbi:hypothetical protein C8J57DRAFT_681410 [Mycena rebaudengoi]|nr:hypothetical protein C8J57DRAFT_681410 [Mycena rebaudengoi]